MTTNTGIKSHKKFQLPPNESKQKQIGTIRTPPKTVQTQDSLSTSKVLCKKVTPQTYSIFRSLNYFSVTKITILI